MPCCRRDRDRIARGIGCNHLAILAFTTYNDIAAIAIDPCKTVVTIAALKLVAANSTSKRIVTSAAVNRVVATKTLNVIIPGTAVDPIGCRAASDGVIAVTAENRGVGQDR